MNLVLKTIIQTNADLHYNIYHSWSYRSNPNNNYHRRYQSAVNRWFGVFMIVLYFIMMMNISMTPYVASNYYERIAIAIMLPFSVLLGILIVGGTIVLLIEFVGWFLNWVEGW